MNAFERLAKLTARLASTANLHEIAETVLEEIVSLGFGAVWIAVLDEPSGNLKTVREVIDGRDTTHEMPEIFMLDTRQPIGHGFRERRMINIKDPASLLILEDEEGRVPPDMMALPRVIFEHLRGHPFACGPLLGSRGQPVGALGLSSYLGQQPIPDEVLEEDSLLTAFMAHLGIAMERALFVQRLEHLNAELVAAQETLLQNARMRAVTELTAAIAHDLNNLSGIALMAVSVGYTSPGAAYKTLPRIERANRAIGDLVGRLQRVARTGTPSVIESVDLTKVLDGVLLMLGPFFREHSIRVTRAVTPLSVLGDELEIQQVLMNVLLNARDALSQVPDDRRTIEIEVAPAGGQVRLRVADSGPGFSPDVLDRAFEPFVTTKGGDHPGIGLATVAGSVKHFGAGVEARNRPGGGAEVEIRFTRAAAPPPAPEPVASSERPDASLKILAIDDEQDVVDIITQYLETRGHDVIGTTAPSEAAELASTNRFDVVLCDVGMPEINGLELCSSLREHGVTSKLILMTGWDQDAVRGDARSASCDGLLKKPFVGDQLDDLIAGLLGQREEDRP